VNVLPPFRRHDVVVFSMMFDGDADYDHDYDCYDDGDDCCWIDWARASFGAVFGRLDAVVVGAVVAVESAVPLLVAVEVAAVEVAAVEVALVGGHVVETDAGDGYCRRQVFEHPADSYSFPPLAAMISYYYYE
jgi:hypothetical protein